MWSSAWQSIQESFPMGIGLGQIPPIVSQTLATHGWQQTSVHNTPINLVMQLGIVALPWLAFGATLILVALWRMPWLLGVNFVILSGAILMLHDAMGLRGFLLLMCIGLVDGFFSPARNRAGMARTAGTPAQTPD